MGAWIETRVLILVHLRLGVAPLVGAWIETKVKEFNAAKEKVAPLVGAWSETTIIKQERDSAASHPSWVRGLKHQEGIISRLGHLVAPLVGAWIET